MILPIRIFQSLSLAVPEAANLIWSYHRAGQPLAVAEGILVYGSDVLRVAEHTV